MLSRPEQVLRLGRGCQEKAAEAHGCGTHEDGALPTLDLCPTLIRFDLGTFGLIRFVLDGDTRAVVGRMKMVHLFALTLTFWYHTPSTSTHV